VRHLERLVKGEDVIRPQQVAEPDWEPRVPPRTSMRNVACLDAGRRVLRLIGIVKDYGRIAAVRLQFRPAEHRSRDTAFPGEAAHGVMNEAADARERIGFGRHEGTLKGECVG
jgi:hypothetical protein